MKMENITKVRYGPMPKNAGLIKPFRMYYVQNNAEKNWDLALVEDTVTVIVYNKSTDKLIFVKQFRPTVYYDSIKKLGYNQDDEIDTEKCPPSEFGITLELCTRAVDKNLPLTNIVQAEVENVCGYKISLDRIEEVMTYRSDVGVSGAEETLFYCEVMNEDRVSNSGDVVNDKVTEVVEMPVAEAKAMVAEIENKPTSPSCLMGVLWFLRNMAVAH